MKSYHISELEQLSGVKAPTIRMWEKRYQLIRPGRTKTNIRTYDDQQVIKLLNIVTLLSAGYKLSSIARLDENDLHAMVLGLQGPNNAESDAAVSLVNDMISAMLLFDEKAFEKAFAAAVRRFGLFDTMLQVCYPLLERVGIMWTTSDLVPVQEHFAAAIIRRKLIVAAEALTFGRKRRKKFLLMLPPGEWHEIGLLFANYLIRSKEVDTLYLGQNVPYDQVEKVFTQANCTHVLLFFTGRPAETKLSVIRQQMKLAAGVPLLYTGSPHAIQNLVPHTDCLLLKSPADLLRLL